MAMATVLWALVGSLLLRPIRRVTNIVHGIDSFSNRRLVQIISSDAGGVPAPHERGFLFVSSDQSKAIFNSRPKNGVVLAA